ncbi:hypothetical protein TWF694_011557 [Orbilia ellipsospora]|uniref:DUF7707 domain-containing protein n=1 Tax=Orbilia ellipsospora TaxID=2528407 RepID=A0AAV9X5J3_9PEZI
MHFLPTLYAYGLLLLLLPPINGQTSIDPNSVTPTDREAWCNSQKQSCVLACPDTQTSSNSCDANDLTYSCVCEDGSTPDLSQYSGTLPYFICQEWKAQCIDAGANNLEAESSCAAVTCGAAALTTGGGGAGAVGSTSTTNPSAGVTPAPGTSSSTPATQTTSPPSSTTTPPSSTNPVDNQSSSSSAGSSSSSSSSSSSPTGTSPTTTGGGGGDGGDNTPSTGKKGLSTGAIAGIAVGIGVPVLGGLLFLAYRWGGRRATLPPPPPNMPPAAGVDGWGKYNPQWQGQGGNENAGGGADPGIGIGNEVGGIEGGYTSYGQSQGGYNNNYHNGRFS